MPVALLSEVTGRNISTLYKALERVRRLEFAELPKTISGKIRRVELRKLEAERRGAKDYDPARRYPQEYWDEDFPELRSGTGAGAG